MNNIVLLLPFVLALFFEKSYTKKFLIRKSFDYCQRTDKQVSLWIDCQNFIGQEAVNCELFNNQLQIFAKYEDQFNYINSPTENLIVYSINNQLYETNCTNISEIMIASRTEACLRDIPVMINITEEFQKQVYLSNEGILRDNTIVSECNGKTNYFQVKDLQITRLDNIITSVKLKANEFFNFFQQKVKNAAKKNENASFKEICFEFIRNDPVLALIASFCGGLCGLVISLCLCCKHCRNKKQNEINTIRKPVELNKTKKSSTLTISNENIEILQSEKDKTTSKIKEQSSENYETSFKQNEETQSLRDTLIDEKTLENVYKLSQSESALNKKSQSLDEIKIVDYSIITEENEIHNKAHNSKNVDYSIIKEEDEIQNKALNTKSQPIIINLFKNAADLSEETEKIEPTIKHDEQISNKIKKGQFKKALNSGEKRGKTSYYSAAELPYFREPQIKNSKKNNQKYLSEEPKNPCDMPALNTRSKTMKN